MEPVVKTDESPGLDTLQSLEDEVLDIALQPLTLFSLWSAGEPFNFQNFSSDKSLPFLLSSPLKKINSQSLFMQGAPLKGRSMGITDTPLIIGNG